MTQSELLAMIDITADHGQPVPTLDDYTVAIDELRARDAIEIVRGRQIAQLVELQTKPVPAFCKDCAHAVKLPYSEECHAPQQSGHDDKIGANAWNHTSTVRSRECHGKWWQAR
jgi:hypothetical protein